MALTTEDSGADESVDEAGSDVEELQQPAVKKPKRDDDEAKQPSASPLRSSPLPRARVGAAAAAGRSGGGGPVLIDSTVSVSSRAAAVSAVNQTLDSFFAPYGADAASRRGKAGKQQLDDEKSKQQQQEEEKAGHAERADGDAGDGEDDGDVIDVEADEEDNLPLSELLSNGKDEAQPLPAAKSRGRGGRHTPSPQPIAPTRP